MRKFPPPVLRGSVYYLYRRVPKPYAGVDGRTFIEHSLHTDSLITATAKAIEVWNRLVAGWEARLAGGAVEAEARFQAARDVAASRGFPYIPATKVAQLSYDELMARLGAAVGSKAGKASELDVDAVLGGVAEPPITVSRALELYWTLAKDKTLEKSEDQLRRWRNPLKKAVANFIAVVGDKPIQNITGNDMLDFREWWMQRLEEEDLTPNSANKDLVHLGAVLKTVNKMKRMGLVLPLTDLSFKAGEAKTRPPFSVGWIKDRLLAPGALDAMNPEARAILLVMVNTGCRPSEVAALSARTIRLDHAVPHISIEPEGRQIKSRHARRTIPALGVSLSALKAFPHGFPRYGQSSASLSATVNKFLRENGLLETSEHTLYSLRHSFEDRMLAAGIDERVRRDLFGHRLDRERYGEGATLEMKRRMLQAAIL